MHCYVENDAATNLLERRWFGAISAAKALQAECETLSEVKALADAAWRRARAQLADLESLRDALGEQVADLDGRWTEVQRDIVDGEVMSAA